MYLNDVDDGGETVFPETTAKPHVGDERYSACARRGVAVKPRRGDALLFWSMDETFTRVDHKARRVGRRVRSFLSARPSVSIPTRRDAFQLHP
jgi:prolyl 4-hydroxylase